jgi:hypothetical protein
MNNNKPVMLKYALLTIFLLLFNESMAQVQVIKTIPAEIDFEQQICDWDGFGFNYVETAQTKDYENFSQDYGGFSLLKEKQKEEILDLVFRNGGLKV